MRKAAAVVVLGVVAGVLLAAPASAQEGLRDPFQPVVDLDPDTSTTTDPTTTTIDTTVDDPVITPSTDDLATTGASPSFWLAIAYVLCACGAGLLVLGRWADPRQRRG